MDDQRTLSARAGWQHQLWPTNETLNTERERWQSRDPANARVHLALACVFLVLVSGPVSIAEIAGIPLGVCFLIGLRHTYKLALWSLVSPMSIAILAWSLFRFLSLAWSQDVVLGLDHLASLRWLWALPVLAPVLHHRRALVGALGAGLMLAMGAQLVNWVGPALDLYSPIWMRAEDRFSGWWHPVVAGTILVGGLGLYSPIALFFSGKTRLYAIAVCALLCVAILATGSRGAWIEAAIVLVFTLGVAIGKLVQSRAVRAHVWRVVFVGSAVCALTLGIVWFMLGDSVRTRYTLAKQDIAQAVDNQDYSSDTGARMAMLIMGWQCFANHPIVGAGEGGYAHWSRARLVESNQLQKTNTQESTPIDADAIIHNHAHNMYLHILATGGVISALLGASVFMLAMWNAVLAIPERNTRENVENTAKNWMFSVAPACGLLAMTVAGLFDAVHINAQTSAWLIVLLALCQRTEARGSSQ